jgi:hypothetical protein
LSGNSFGLQACRILADRLAKCEKLSVLLPIYNFVITHTPIFTF